MHCRQTRPKQMKRKKIHGNQLIQWKSFKPAEGALSRTIQQSNRHPER